MLKKCLPILFVISGCADVVIPDIEWCVSVGTQGALCQNSNTDKKRKLNVDEWVDFLEAGEQKGPALCVASADFTKLKTTIEQLCVLLGEQCTYDRLRLERFYEQLNHTE